MFAHTPHSAGLLLGASPNCGRCYHLAVRSNIPSHAVPPARAPGPRCPGAPGGISWDPSSPAASPHQLKVFSSPHIRAHTTLDCAKSLVSCAAVQSQLRRGFRSSQRTTGIHPHPATLARSDASDALEQIRSTTQDDRIESCQRWSGASGKLTMSANIARRVGHLREDRG